MLYWHLDSMLCQLICMAYIMNMSLLLTIFVGLGCCVGRLLDISLVLWYLGYALPPIGGTPLLRNFNYWYGFFPSLALLYEPSGVWDYKGPHALTGLLTSLSIHVWHPILESHAIYT